MYLYIHGYNLMKMKIDEFFPLGSSTIIRFREKGHITYYYTPNFLHCVQESKKFLKNC